MLSISRKQLKQVIADLTAPIGIKNRLIQISCVTVCTIAGLYGCNHAAQPKITPGTQFENIGNANQR